MRVWSKRALARREESESDLYIVNFRETIYSTKVMRGLLSLH